MSNLKKIRRSNGSFLADDIHSNRAETIKVVDEKGTVNGLQFIVYGEEALISDQWRKGNHKSGIFM